MAENSKIEWTDHTFNPWVGCTKVSQGGDNCYAESWAKRTGSPELWTGKLRRTTEANWIKVLKWNDEARRTGKRRRVFCASMADVFDNQVPDGWRRDLWFTICNTRHLDWLLLTKRPQNIAKMLPPDWGPGWQNVWLGTTVENQEGADRRIPHLLAVPAAARFLSCEPLLGPVNLDDLILHSSAPGEMHYSALSNDGLCDVEDDSWEGRTVNWVICGGESGPKARPMHPDWARSLRNQCQAAGVPFFFKQWGEWAWAEDHLNFEDAELVLNGRFGKKVELLLHSDGRTSARVGKLKAGRLLAGREWNEFPTTGRAA